MVVVRAVLRGGNGGEVAMNCGIQSTCRWITQEGEAVCRACQRVIYAGRPVESRDPETVQPENQ